jgi:hypothetical protein
MSFADNIKKSLPSDGVPATGFFQPAKNIESNTFDTSGNQPQDAPYNQYPIIGDASSNLVGSVTTPYLPVALPAYIPTIYKNIYDIQNNLENVIPATDVSDNRVYPTTFAVKNYVQSQLFGSEVLDPSSSSTSLLQPSTGLTNTLVLSADAANVNNFTTVIYDSGTYNVTSYTIETVDQSRNGAQKNVICVSDLTTEDSNPVIMQISAGEPDINDDVNDPTLQPAFVVSGTAYRYYQFVGAADALTLIQYNNGTEPSRFFVIGQYGGNFSNTLFAVDSNSKANGITNLYID